MFRNLAIVSASIFLFPLSVLAAQCPSSSYSPNERAMVRAVFYHTSALLGRMHQLAVVSLGEDLSAAQRQALEYEFEVLRSEITRVGSAVEGVSGATKRFLDTVVDSSYLRLDHLRLSGATLEEALKNSRGSALQIQASTTLPWQCF